MSIKVVSCRFRAKQVGRVVTPKEPGAISVKGVEKVQQVTNIVSMSTESAKGVTTAYGERQQQNERNVQARQRNIIRRAITSLTVIFASQNELAESFRR